MTDIIQTYTYRSGEKVILNKRPDQFVARALPDALKAIDVHEGEQVSSASTRVNCSTDDLEQLMSRSRGIAPTHHAYYMDDTGAELLITDRIIVTFKDALPAQEVDAFAGDYGLIKQESYSDRDYLFQLTNHTGINPVKLVVKLTEDDSRVALAEHDMNYRMQSYQLFIPDDPQYDEQWHLHTHNNDPQVDARSSSRCEDAWQLLNSYGSENIVIGVTDDGCKLDHIDFDSPEKFAGWGYMNGQRLIKDTDIDAEPDQMYQLGSNHGTSCAGVISGEVDAQLTVGAAPGCQLLPIKWQSSGPSLFISDSKLLTILNYVSDKVDILSNSWGIVPESRWISTVINRIKDLAKTGGRRGKGIVFLWAAGNENCPIKHTADVDVPYSHGWEFANGSWQWAGVKFSRQFKNNLVSIPGVVHVAALASNAQRSHYSNYGTGIGICAPTSNSHAYYRSTVTGLGVTTTTGSTGGVTDSFGGTSSATPLVAGIAALTLSANPDLSAYEVISVLKQTAFKDLRMDPYPRTPPANFDLDTSWDVSPIAPFDSGEFRDIDVVEGTWSPWFGHGRVDAVAAVNAAIQRRNVETQIHHFESSPALDIPDDDIHGVKDKIVVQDTGRLKEVQIHVDITHTWIGDLRIKLEAPDGTQVILHNKTGSKQKNIDWTYTIANKPELAVLREKNVSGEWSLHVQDLWNRDEGILNRWSMDITVGQEPMIVEDMASVRIPDDEPSGVTRHIDLPRGTTLRELSVAVDISHPWVGDLRVTLTPPNGLEVPLYEGNGESGENLDRTWRSEEISDLQALQGTDVGGTWQLQVVDQLSRDEGKLNWWKLEVTP